MNPLEELAAFEKEAFIGLSGSDLGRIASTGAVTAGATAAVAGTVPAVKAIYNAATAKRDFNAMLSFDPNLKEMHRSNPKYINASFRTLRRLNPEFSKDPMIASSYVSNIVASGGEGALGMAQDVMRSAPRPSAMQDAFVSGASQGVSGALHDVYARQKEQRDLDPREKLKLEHGYRMGQESFKQNRQRELEIMKQRMQHRGNVRIDKMRERAAYRRNARISPP